MFNKKVVSVSWNWFVTESAGEEFSQHRLSGDTEMIVYHEAAGIGDQHYCDIIMKDGNSKRVFNLNAIEFESK